MSKKKQNKMKEKNEEKVMCFVWYIITCRFKIYDRLIHSQMNCSTSVNVFSIKELLKKHKFNESNANIHNSKKPQLTRTLRSIITYRDKYIRDL